MRRAYVEGHVPFVDAFQIALRWAGDDAAIRVGDTGTVENNKWMERLGIPITSASSRSRFHGMGRGTVIGAFLNLSEVLELERSDYVNGIVVVPWVSSSVWALVVVADLGPWLCECYSVFRLTRCLWRELLVAVNPAGTLEVQKRTRKTSGSACLAVLPIPASAAQPHP